jgi:hypothetical protein
MKAKSWYNRTRLSGFAALLSVTAHAADQIAYYNNVRFGYAIAYPPTLLAPQPEADNGDGLAFKAKHGTARFLVYGRYNVLDESPGAIAESAEADCPAHRADYRVTKRTVVAISCANATDIIYQKTLIRGDVLTTLSAKYPKAERKVWDSVVARMAQSLAPGK